MQIYRYFNTYILRKTKLKDIFLNEIFLEGLNLSLELSVIVLLSVI
jgi:hypothetical protein